jgi:hypothetical protein
LSVFRGGETIDKQITIGNRPSITSYLTGTPQPSP